MHNNKSVKTILASLLAIGLLVSVFFLYIKQGQDKLRNSLGILMMNVLNTQHKVLVENLDNHGPDLSGYWIVHLDKEFRSKIFTVKEFDKSDNADLGYYKQVFQSKLGINNKELEGYELFRAEMALGQGAICEKYPCNIEILTKNGNEDVYVGISKI